MSINVNVGNFIPANVVEVGNEISADQLAAITAAASPSATNPFSTSGHIHVIGNITGLQTALDGKASSSHTHLISNITGLQSELNEKASLGHIHEIVSVTGLQTALDGKAGLVHTHVISDVTGLQTALDGKLSATHNHDGVYAPVSHTHTIANVTGLQTALDGKASATHTHAQYATLTGATFSGEIEAPQIGNLLNTDLVIDSYNDTGAGTHYYHKFTPFDGRFNLAPNGGGLVFPDATIQSTASYSKAQSDAHLVTVASWVNGKADWGHTHAITDVTNLQTALDSKLTVPQSWLEFDMGRTFTISNGVLSWDNGGSTISHPVSGTTAGTFTFNKKISCTTVDGVAGINIGVGGTEGASTNAGDIWVNSGSSYLNFRDGSGNWRYCLVNNQANSIDVSTATAPALRVTQRGAGNAFVVEDSTTPDSTSFIVSNDGRVGIGVSSVNQFYGFEVMNPLPSRFGNNVEISGQAIVSGGLNVNGNSVNIDMSTTASALRVTQRGTGNSLMVEDSTNPDSTAFIVSNAGAVGIGVPNGWAPIGAGVILDVNGSVNINGSLTLPAAVPFTPHTINGVSATFQFLTVTGGVASLVSDSTSNVVCNIASGAIGASKQKNIEIGCNGLSGSTTIVRIGSNVSGNTSYVTINGSASFNSPISLSGQFVNTHTNSFSMYNREIAFTINGQTCYIPYRIA